MKTERRRMPSSTGDRLVAADAADTGHRDGSLPTSADAPMPPGLEQAQAPAFVDASVSRARLRSRIESLRLIETACWQELATAVRERGHGWRVMTLATIDGDRADARSVVLREVDAARRRLLFYTDTRSPKVAQIQAHPRGTAVGWCAALSWQVRLHTRLSIESQTAATRLRWSRLQMTPGAQDYMSPLAPGQTLSEPGHESGAREHFAILEGQVEALDWLELHADGHRRAIFDHTGSRWVQP